jgi:uncharacterized membrane protein (UPF0127 family)
MLHRLAVVLLFTLAASACSDESPVAAPTPVDDGRVTVRVGDALTIDAELALTPEQRQLGLGQRDALEGGTGMLFVFTEADTHTFCMCGMRFPLDFIWIGDDGRVVDLSRDIPPPDETGGEPQTITPGQPVLYVLEVNAGVIDESGVEAGDTVSFEPEVSPDDAS